MAKKKASTRTAGNKRNKLWLWVIIVVAVAAAVGLVVWNVAKGGGDTASADEIVYKMRLSDRIYVSEVVVQKIVTADDVKRLNIGSMSFQLPLGDRKVAIPMDAVLKAYIDFDSLAPADVKVSGSPRRLEINLRAPKVEMTSSKINQDEVKECIDILRCSFSDEELTKFENQGREVILASIPELGIEKQAERNAREILVPMFMQFGFKDNEIIINFQN